MPIVIIELRNRLQDSDVRIWQHNHISIVAAPQNESMLAVLATQGRAEEAVQTEEQLVAALKREVGAFGQKHIYSKSGSAVGKVRKPRSQVTVKFCAQSGGQNPWAQTVIFTSDGFQGDEAREFIKQIQAGAVLPRVARIFADDATRSTFASALHLCGTGGAYRMAVAR